MPVTLVQITAFDPVADAAVTVRVCNADDHRVTALNGQRWWPVLARAPRRRLDLFDGDFSGQIAVGIGDLDIATRADVPVLANAPRYSWGERAVTIWRGPLGGAWSDYVQVFTGLTRPARGGNGRLTIGLRPDDRWRDKPLLPTYAGTGGIEGPAALKGRPKPLAFGAPQHVPGVQIDPALNIWQLHAFAIQGVPVVFDRLARYSGGAYAGDSADYAALAAADIPNGAWRSCLALGLVRFGAPPAVPSFHVEGDNVGGWHRRPGAVIGRIAEIAGATTGQIDASSLTALDAWAATLPAGGNLSLWLGEQNSAGQIIQTIAASCNAAAGVGFDGRLFVARAGIGAPSLTLAADGSRAPAVADVRLLETSAPFWRAAMTAEITNRVHGESDYGQIGSADQLAYADGTAVETLKPAQAGADVTATALGDDAILVGDAAPIALGALIAAATSSPTVTGFSPVSATGPSGFIQIRLAAGQSVGVTGFTRANLTSGTGAVQMLIQARPGTSGSFSTIASDTSPTEPSPVQLEASPSGTLTNSGSEALVYQVSADVSFTGGAGGTVDSAVSYIQVG